MVKLTKCVKLLVVLARIEGAKGGRDTGMIVKSVLGNYQ